MFWDVRRASPVNRIAAASTPDMTCMAVHEFAPLIAVGSSRKQYIQVRDARVNNRVSVFLNSGWAG